MTQTSAPATFHVPNGDIYLNDSIPEIAGTNKICIPENAYQTKLTWFSDSGQVPGTLDETPVDVDELVECLIDLGDEIVCVLRSESSNHLGEQLVEWCDLHGFDTVSDPETQTCIARQAALAFLLRSTLYEWHHRRGVLPPLSSKIRIELELADVWIDELGTDWCVLDFLIHLVDQPALESVTALRGRLLKSSQPAEDIGRLYEALLTGERRRTLGQFRTPPAVSEFMQAWALQGGDSILDPGIGTGILSSPFHPGWELSTDHNLVFGIDRSPLSILMGTTALTLYGQNHTVRTTDFLALSRNEIPPVDAIICNPPYSKPSDLPTAYKNTIRERLEEKEIEIQGKAPLYAYFLIHAATVLDDKQRCALLIPSAWMNARYGTGIKQFLLDQYRIIAIIGNATGQFINEASVDTVILLVERATDHEDRKNTVVSFVKVTENLGWIKQQVGFATVVSMLTDDKPTKCSAVEILPRQQSELRPGDDWGQYIRGSETEIEEVHAQLTVELQDLAEVKTGLTSGYNAAFYFSDGEAARASIESAYLEPLIKSPTDCETYRITDRDIDWWVLAVSEKSADLQGTGVERYLKAQEAKGVSDRPALVNKSTEWFVQKIRTAPILQPYTVGKRHFTCFNATTACVDKRLVCIDPHDEDHEDFLFVYLNSTLGVLLKELHGSVRANGGLGTTVSMMQKFPVFDPSQLSIDQHRALRLAAERLKAEPIQSIYAELGAENPENVTLDAVSETRRVVDSVIMSDVLGFSRQAQLQLYRDVLKLVTNRNERS